MTADVFSPGTVLRGKYRVERSLGAGGMGIVVLATHLRLSQPVAIKLLRPEARGNPDVVQRFAREARAASKLRGEHAVRILDVDDSEAGDPFLVMEYLEGTDLQRHLETKGALLLEDAVGFVLQACEGIAEAHGVGIVHRDLKPGNLFVTSRPDGTPLVKILDFGISKATEREAAADFVVTKPASAIGSPAYMSPEQLKDSGGVDARTDVWALGVVLYQLLTNALPFEATSTAALAARIAADPPRPLRALRPEAPDALEAVVLRCLAKVPAERFADVAALARSLAPFAHGGESGAVRVARVAEKTALRSDAVGKGAGESAQPPSAGPPEVSHTRDAMRIDGPSAHRTAALDEGERAPSPLAKALETEYASSVGTPSPIEPAPPRRPMPWRALALGAGLLLATTTWLVVRSPPPPTTRSAAGGVDTPAGPPPRDELEATAPAVDSPPSGQVNAGERLDAGARPAAPARMRRDTTPPKPSATGRNPLDLDFR
jgi:serine/threonine-protein kinase